MFNPTLPNEFAYATECNLATLSGLLGRKSSSKSEVKRQTSICLRMLLACKAAEHEIDWGHPVHHFGRVEDIVRDPERNIQAALDKFVTDRGS